MRDGDTPACRQVGGRSTWFSCRRQTVSAPANIRRVLVVSNTMRVIHTIAGTRETHGGTSRCVPFLCDGLATLGIDTHLITAVPADPSIASCLPTSPCGVHLARESRILRQWNVAKQFRANLESLISIDAGHVIVHDHGLWLATNHTVSVVAKQLGVSRVISPHGMLSKWSVSRRGLLKKICWTAYQQRDLLAARAFVANSAAEAEDIRRYKLKQPIAVIPHAVNFPTKLPVRSSAAGGVVLSLTRIHPVKGLLVLVEAWKRGAVPEPWTLVLAGPDEVGHLAEVAKRVDELGLGDQVKFAGALSDHQKWQALVDADLFVLSSYSENFGVGVAEAMSAGLPVIATTGTPWRRLVDLKCGWWVEPTSDGLAKAIQEATSLSQERRAEMGDRGEKWAREMLAIESVSQKYNAFYRWLVGLGDAPEFIL